MRSFWLPWPLLLAGLLALAASPSARVHAEDKRAAALSWVRLAGAETCLDASRLARGVEARLKRQVFPAPAQATLIVEGRAEKTADGFAATLRIFDQAGAALGSRDLSSNKPDCSELSEAVVLVLAVMIDPDGALAAIPSSVEEKPPEAQPVVSAPTAAPQTKPEKPTLGALSAFARLELGSLPSPAWGVGAGALVSFAPLLTFRIEGAAFLEERATQPGDVSRGASFGLLYGGLEYCPLFVARPRFGVAGCAGASVGAMLSQSFGLDPREKDQVDPVINGNARLRVDVLLLGPVYAMLGAGVGTPFVRTLYEVTKLDGSTQPLFQAESVQASFDLGLAARF